MKYEKAVSLMTGIAAVIFAMIGSASAYNFEYLNVTSQVNVTNAYPEITSITMGASVLLSAGTTSVTYCNLSINDWNGYTDIIGVNATLWDNATVAVGDSDNPNNHYTNTSCGLVNGNGYYANYSCAFNVWYYANPSTDWICNATVIDNANFTDTGYNTTEFLAYYALNVTPVIDYGDMILATISSNITANITNIGNSRINISVRGYGVTPGDGLAMVCQSGNITIGNEKFSASLVNWSSKTPLSGTLQNITGISIPKRVNAQTWNLTYWQLYTNPANTPFGECNGTIEFNAIAG